MGIIVAELSNRDKVEYYGELQFGSEEQPLTFVFDTGSSVLLIYRFSDILYKYSGSGYLSLDVMIVTQTKSSIQINLRHINYSLEKNI